MGFLSSIFTPPGTHAAKKQQKRQQQVAITAGDLLPGISDNLRSELEFAHMYEPHRREMIDQLLADQGSGNAQASADAFRRAALSSAGENSQQEGNMLRGQGFSDAAREGATRSMYTGAQRDANQYEAQLMSPEEQTRRKLASLQTLGYAMQAPSWQDFNNAAGAIYGEPKVQVGPGALDYLTSIAGSFVGGMGGGGAAHSTAAAGGAAAAAPLPANPGFQIPTQNPWTSGSHYNFGFGG